ncbi:creatininase family protein [Microbaculum marinum]|uniref:Creatininase family protein n=1 Tax=Microbaculum marinum TaxID=1764581 RepID=A0AAW9RUD3_9HYPH
MTLAHRWQDLTTVEFETLDPDTTVAVLPVGAIEQHGPHLPLATDALVAERVAAAAVETATAGDPDLPVLLLPTMPVGKSNEHIDFPGTLTLTAESLIALWREIGESVARSGIRKLLMVNAHGGQPQVMEIVARELRVRCEMLCVSSSWWHMGLPEGLVPAEEQRHGIHGGMVETSLVLHLAPDLVRMEHAADFRPVMAEIAADNEKLTYVGGVGIGWQAQDIHPAGVAGNAAAATAELGKAIFDHVVSGYVRLLAEISAYPLSRIQRR